MRAKNMILSLFAISLMLFFGVTLYHAGENHITKIYESNSLFIESIHSKSDNCSLAIENKRLLYEINDLKEEIKYKDSLYRRLKR